MTSWLAPVKAGAVLLGCRHRRAARAQDPLLTIALWAVVPVVIMGTLALLRREPA